jgi:hypothetical protein
MNMLIIACSSSSSRVSYVSQLWIKPTKDTCRVDRTRHGLHLLVW